MKHNVRYSELSIGFVIPKVRRSEYIIRLVIPNIPKGSLFRIELMFYLSEIKIRLVIPKVRYSELCIQFRQVTDSLQVFWIPPPLLVLWTLTLFITSLQIVINVMTRLEPRLSLGIRHIPGADTGGTCKKRKRREGRRGGKEGGERR